MLGKDSNLTFVGDENVLKALGVTQIQKASDSALNVRVTDAQGIEHRTGWCYPKMKLLRMVHDGDLRGLSMR